MNAQLIMDFIIMAKQSVTNHKILDMYFYLMYVKLWDIKYLKFRTLKVHLVNETFF
jgi:hypothetical protein